MSTVSPIFIFLALVLVVLTGRRALPLLLFSLDPRTIRVWFDDPLQTASLLAHSSALRGLVATLKSLGFLSLGLKIERLPLGGPAYRELTLASGERSTFASIVLHPTGEPASLYLYTPLEGGGMVFTRNFGFGREAEGAALSVRNVPGGPPEEICAVHDSRVEEFKGRGLIPSSGYDQQRRIEATRAFYASSYARQGAPYLKSPDVLAFFFMLSVLALAIAAAF